ncbi:MAG: hypothetical protein RRY07_01770 [Bacteroidaceae bacterium]
MNQIRTLAQLKELQNETMVYAIIVFLIALLIAWICSNIISYQGGNDRSFIKRRIWYIVIGLLASLGFYLYNGLLVSQRIVNAGFKSMFSGTNFTCLGITITGYAIVGVIIMFVFRHSKFGSILGKEKK